MKKILVLLCALVLIVSGCGKKEEQESKEESPKIEEVTKEDNKEKEEEKQEEKQEEKKEETKKEDTTTNNDNKKETATKTETKKDEVKPTCTPKKFAHKYSYVYSDKATCQKDGNLKFLDISDNTDPDIFAYDCKEITDECGTKYYGVVFYKWSEEKGEYPVYY